MVRRVPSVFFLVAGMTVCSSGAQAQRDFLPDNTEWNGLSELLVVAEEEELSVEVVDRLDVGTLDADAAILVVGPVDEPSIEGLSALLRAGARIAVADDFGASDALLEAFHIDRREPTPHRATALRGNEALLIARPRGPHTLSLRVEALVTNHPQVIRHLELEPIFAFSENEALVLAGAVGTGRLVVISDPSVLINNMLELGGNRRFAANLLRYLAGVSPGSEDAAPRRIVLVPPGAAIVGRFGEPGDRSLHDLRDDLRAFLERLGEVEVPAVGLRVLGLCLVLIFVLIASGILPRRSPYGARAMFSPATTFGGMAGRIAWYGRGNVDLLDPLLAYRFELETELLRRLQLDHGAGVDAVVRALAQRGLASQASAARTLLSELAEVAARADRGTVEPVNLARLKDVMRRGDGLLAHVGTGTSASTSTSGTSTSGRDA